MSRIPDRRAALTHGFHLTCHGTASAVGLQWPITCCSRATGARTFGRRLRFNPSHLSGPKAFTLCTVRNGPPSQPRRRQSARERTSSMLKLGYKLTFRGARPDRPGAQRQPSHEPKSPTIGDGRALVLLASTRSEANAALSPIVIASHTAHALCELAPECMASPSC